MSFNPDTEPVAVNPNGELFNKQGDLVKFKPTKAVIGGVLGLVSMISTGLTAVYSDNPALVIVNIVVGSLATVLGIYLPSNAVKRS